MSSDSQFRIGRFIVGTVLSLLLPVVLFVGYLFRPQSHSELEGISDVASVALATLQLPPTEGSILEQDAKIEAAGTEWESEAFHEQVVKQLYAFGDAIRKWPATTDDELSKLVDDAFRCTPLRTENPKTVLVDDLFDISRSESPELLNDKSYAGVQVIQKAINKWLQPLGELQNIRLDTKVSHVELEEDSATTTVHATLSGRAATKPFQENAIWICKWSRTANSSPPRLIEIRLESVETVRLTRDEYLFSDNTESILRANSCYEKQFCYGATHWCQRLVARMGVYLRSLHGMSVADVNGDGLDDLFICEPGGLPNRLFVQNPDGTATDVSEGSGVNLLEPTRGAIIADFDNDGNQDIALSLIYSAIAIFRGSGDGKFTLVTAIPVRGKAYSLASADYDRDGLLDIYICVYNDVAGEIGESGGGIPEPYYDANQGAANVLLRNQGGLRFTEVTKSVGLNVNNRRFSYAASWEDFDNDGDQDLYVANDFGRNNLYRNEEGKFIDVARQAGVEDIASGMGVSWGDYDNDGMMDVYVANMWSSAGSRITFQRKFPAKDESTRKLFTRLARGNSMFRNQGDGLFEDTSFSAAVTLGRWAWGANFVDINNDGFEDLAVANGFVTGQQSQDL